MKKRILRATILGLIAAGAVGGGTYWYLHRFDESTDNAYVHGDITAIAPKVSGYVVAIPVHDNQSVRAGDILVRIEDRDYQARVDQAQAGIKAAEAAISQIDKSLIAQQAVIAEARAGVDTWKAEEARARRELKRTNSLVRNDYASRQSQDNARADADKATAGLAQAEAQVASAESQVAVLQANRKAQEAALLQAKATLELAQANLDHTVITAPVDGVIGNRAVRLGQYVAPGTQMMALVPLDSLWIEANYKETQITDMEPGQTARISVDAFPDVPLTGVVDSLSPASGGQFSLLPAENASGNFTKIVQRIPVRIRLPKDNPLLGKLRPGLSVIVDVDTASKTVPTTSAQTQLSAAEDSGSVK